MNIAPSTEMEIDGVATTSAIPINEVATPGEAQTLATLTGALTTWLKTIGGLLSSLDYHLAEIQANSINDIKMKNNLDDQINRTLGEIKGKETKELGSLGGSSWTAASPGMGYSAKGPGKILGGGEEEMELDEEIDVKSRRGEKEGNRKSKRARDTKSKD